jgi:ABC-2 type transport system permease protein
MTAYTALTRAGYRAYVRDQTTLFFTFAFPLLFLGIFGLIFRGQTVDGGLPYINYIAPGVLSWGVGNAAVFAVAFTLMHWRRDDILRLIWRTPAGLGSVVGSRFTVAMGVGLIQAVLFAAIALLPFFGLRLTSTWPLALPVLVCGILAFLALGLVIGSVADTPEAVGAVGNFIMVPMAFLAGAFYPLDLMPGWLQAVSHALPLRYFNDGVADALSGRATWAGTGLDCAALAGFTVLFGLIGLRMFRWSSRR